MKNTIRFLIVVFFSFFIATHLWLGIKNLFGNGIKQTRQCLNM